MGFKVSHMLVGRHWYTMLWKYFICQDQQREYTSPDDIEEYDNKISEFAY